MDVLDCSYLFAQKKVMVEKFLQTVEPVLPLFFLLHDMFSDILIRFGREIKRGILIIAHLSLVVGMLLPELRRGFGTLAGSLLIGLLFASPLSKIFRMKVLLLLMGFRREVGILMGYAALVHGLTYMLSGYDIRSMLSFGQASLVTLAPLLGLIALFLILPLIVTSNTLSTQWLGLWWKRLHRLVYPAFVLILIHWMFISNGRHLNAGSFRMIQLLSVLGTYVVLKYFAGRPSLAIERFSQAVALRYAAYRTQGTSVGFSQ